MTLNIEAIGTVKSPIMEGVDEDWGGVVSEIHIEERYSPGRVGLNEISHLLDVF